MGSILEVWITCGLVSIVYCLTAPTFIGHINKRPRGMHRVTAYLLLGLPLTLGFMITGPFGLLLVGLSALAPVLQRWLDAKYGTAKKTPDKDTRQTVRGRVITERKRGNQMTDLPEFKAPIAITLDVYLTPIESREEEKGGSGKGIRVANVTIGMLPGVYPEEEAIAEALSDALESTAQKEGREYRLCTAEEFWGVMVSQGGPAGWSMAGPEEEGTSIQHGGAHDALERFLDEAGALRTGDRVSLPMQPTPPVIGKDES